MKLKKETAKSKVYDFCKSLKNKRSSKWFFWSSKLNCSNISSDNFYKTWYKIFA